MIVLNGKETAKNITDEIAEIVKKRKNDGKKIPHLAAILVGNDGGSITYINNKLKACESCGFESTLMRFDDSVKEEIILNKIQTLNEDDNVDGFIVQLPLPKHIDETKVILSIDPKKDVDGFHPMNIGKMTLNLPSFISATPSGIIELIRRYKIDTKGKNCVIIGRSNIVGMPLSILLSQNKEFGNCTVTLTHSQTKNLKEICKTADILIAAIGQPKFVTEDMVKDGAVVIDVGITRVEDKTKLNGWRLVGDVDFDSVSNKSVAITPVPGGVGPMTIASLMLNTLKAMDMKE